jgi:hypothetical protein
MPRASALKLLLQCNILRIVTNPQTPGRQGRLALIRAAKPQLRCLFYSPRRPLGFFFFTNLKVVVVNYLFGAAKIKCLAFQN